MNIPKAGVRDVNFDFSWIPQRQDSALATVGKLWRELPDSWKKGLMQKLSDKLKGGTPEELEEKRRAKAEQDETDKLFRDWENSAEAVREEPKIDQFVNKRQKDNVEENEYNLSRARSDGQAAYDAGKAAEQNAMDMEVAKALTEGGVYEDLDTALEAVKRGNISTNNKGE